MTNNTYVEWLIKNGSMSKSQNAVKILAYIDKMSEQEAIELIGHCCKNGGITETGHPFQELTKHSKKGLNELRRQVKEGIQAEKLLKMIGNNITEAMSLAYYENMSDIDEIGSHFNGNLMEDIHDGVY